MVIDLNDTHHKRLKFAIKASKSPPPDNPLDDFSISDDQTNHPPNPTGVISSPPFYTKRPNIPNKMAGFKSLPKQKHFLHHKLVTYLTFIFTSKKPNITKLFNC